MNFDIEPLQAMTSPLAISAGSQAAAPSEEFAVLMDIGAPPSKTGKPVENASTMQSAEPFNMLNLSDISTDKRPETAPAIAQADALVSALSSDAKASRMLGGPRETTLTMTTEDTPSPEPIIASTPNPVAARSVNTVPTDLPVQEPSRRFAPMSRKSLDDKTDDQSETDDQPERTVEEVVAAQIFSTEPYTPAPAVTQVAPTPVPIQEPAAALSATTFETQSSPEPVNDKRETAPKAAATSGELRLGDAMTIRNFDSIALQAEEQIRETQSQSLSSARPIAAASKPTAIQQPLSEAASRLIAISGDHFADRPASKVAHSHAPEVTDTGMVAAHVSPDFDAIPLIKSPSDLPSAAPAPTAIVNAPVSTIDTILDRQLDLVRNERWLGELAQDIASASDNKDQLSFRLMPRQLGRLDIDVSRSHTGISLTIRTESDSAQSILTAAQPRLADELRAHGVMLADTQMFSSDARHSQHHGSAARPAFLIENSLTQTDAPDAPEQVQRDGRYA